MRAIACVCVLAGALGVWPVPSADAGCGGPVLAVGPVPEAGASPPIPALAIDSVTLVSGEGFHTGCDDTGQGSGCGAPPSEQAPMRGVALVLQQGPATRELATSDAADRQDRYGISWQVRVPPDFRPGPATLRAAGTTLAVHLRAP